MPNTVERFIRDSAFAADYFFAVATCGAMGGDAIGAVGELLRQKGQTLHYGKVCRAYPNYIAMYPMLLNRRRVPAAQDKRMAKIAGDIAGRVQTDIPQVSKMAKKMAAERAKYLEMDNQFTVSDFCVKCGLCAKICPVGNISIEAGKPQFTHKCEQCMACVQWCPQKAINTPKTVKRRRYTNPSIRAEDLIQDIGVER
jgi:ferredoxin